MLLSTFERFAKKGKMDQDKLRRIGDKEAIKTELVREFTKHLEEPTLLDDSVVKVKLVVLGPMQSGKTSWVTRITHDKFNAVEPPTIGAKFSAQGVAVDDVEYQFEIWDVSGEEWCRALCPMYLQHAHATIICYDPNDNGSVEEAKEWISFAKKQGDRNLIIAVVGTKFDMCSDVVSATSIPSPKKIFVDEEGLESQFFFPDVSNKTGENVQDVILTIAEAFHERGVQTGRDSVKDADQEFGTLLNKGLKTQDFTATKEANPLNNDEVDRCKSRLEKVSDTFKSKAFACFDSSKRTVQTTYVSTREKSTYVAQRVNRNSKRFATSSKRLIKRNKENEVIQEATI